MQELRLVEIDGAFATLEAQDGQQFRLAIDDALRSAVKTQSTLDKASLTLTPREIQSEIRAGATVEELVQRWNDPIEYVAKFAQPIIDELGHIVHAAQGVRISIAGDRYNDDNHTEFGEIISSRLDASGARAVAWNAARDEAGTWRVSVSYSLGGEEGVATWAFDPKKLILSPENQNAIALSTQNTLVAPTAPKLAAVETSFFTEQLEDTLKVDTVIPLGRTSERELTSIAAVEPDDPTENERGEDLATTSNLLDALKKKRESREHPSTQVVEIVTEAEASQEVIEIEEPSPKPAPTKRNSRPAIPSFDEIVQGTKSDEE